MQIKPLSNEDLKTFKCYYDTYTVPIETVCDSTDTDQIALNNLVMNNTYINSQTKISGTETSNAVWKIRPKNPAKSVQWNVLICNDAKQNIVANTNDITDLDTGKVKSVSLLTAPYLFFNIFNFSIKDSFNNFNVENLLLANSPCNYLFNFNLLFKNFKHLTLLQQNYVKLSGGTMIVCQIYTDNDNIFYILCIYNIYLVLCHFKSLFHVIFKLNTYLTSQAKFFLSPQLQKHFVFVENRCHNGNCEIWDDTGKGDDYYRRKVMNFQNPHEDRAINGYRHGHLWRREEIDKFTTGTRPQIFQMYVGIGDKVFVCLIDSGAEFSSISGSVASELNLPQYPIKKGALCSKGVAGEYDITHAVKINIIFHDLEFSEHIFKINDTGTTQFKVIIGTDFLRAFNLIVDPFNLSISRQISDHRFGVCTRIM